MKNRFVIFLLAGLALAACGEEKQKEQNTEQQVQTNENQSVEPVKMATSVPYEITDSSKIQSFPSGLKLYMVQEGPGQLPQQGEKILIHYHGMLEDSSVFDSSFERGAPLEFTLGVGQVIKGWDEGIAKLPFGSKAILIIPPDLGYGAQSTPSIPANSTLIFHVELLGKT